MDDIYECYGHRWRQYEDNKLGANVNDIEHMEVSLRVWVRLGCSSEAELLVQSHRFKR